MHRRREKLTKEEVSELRVWQEKVPDARSAIRCQAVRLYGSGYEVKAIREICNCSRQAIQNWNRKYHQGGVVALLDGRQGGNRAYLTAEQNENLKEKLHQYEPHQLFGPKEYEGDGVFWTVQTLAQLVEREYGVVYRYTSSYRELFEKCGFSYQRPAKQYLSRNEEKVMAFEETLEKKCSISLRMSLRR